MSQNEFTPKILRHFKKQSRGTFISSEITLFIDPTFYPSCFKKKSQEPENENTTSDTTSEFASNPNLNQISTSGVFSSNSYSESVTIQENTYANCLDAKKLHDSFLFATVKNSFHKFHFTENPIPFSVMWQRERPKAFEEIMCSQDNTNDDQQNSFNDLNRRLYSSRMLVDTEVIKTLLTNYIFLRIPAKKFITLYLEQCLDDFFEELFRGFQEINCKVVFFALEGLDREILNVHKKLVNIALKNNQNEDEIVMPFQEGQIKNLLFQKQWELNERHSINMILHYPRTERDTGQYLLQVTKSVAMEDYFDPRTEFDLTSTKSKKVFNGKVENLHDSWLAFLLEIPNVRKDHALAIQAKYPTLKSIIKVYIDPLIQENEKKYLLCDLQPLHGRGRVGPKVSISVYEYFLSKMGKELEDSSQSQSQDSSQASISSAQVYEMDKEAVHTFKTFNSSISRNIIDEATEYIYDVTAIPELLSTEGQVENDVLSFDIESYSQKQIDFRIERREAMSPLGKRKRISEVENEVSNEKLNIVSIGDSASSDDDIVLLQ